MHGRHPPAPVYTPTNVKPLPSPPLPSSPRQVMVKEGKLPFVFADRPARIGVLPRCARSADDNRWFTAERLMSFHVANGGWTGRCACATYVESVQAGRPVVGG